MTSSTTLLFGRRPSATLEDIMADADTLRRNELIARTFSLLSSRLTTSYPVKEGRSHGYDDDQWNNRLLIRFDLREMFRGHLFPQTSSFAEDNDVLGACETESAEALCWDEAGFNDDLGKHGIQHYLLDDTIEGLEKVVAALETLPEITDYERRELLEQIIVGNT